MSRKKGRKKKWHLKKGSLPKNIRWMHDMDYIEKLSPEEKEFMNKFVKEYYDGNVKKDDYDALHCDDESRRECYGNKNRQNRDLMSIMDSGGKMLRVDDDRAETEED